MPAQELALGQALVLDLAQDLEQGLGQGWALAQDSPLGLVQAQDSALAPASVLALASVLAQGLVLAQDLAPVQDLALGLAAQAQVPGLALAQVP